ncbi:MAG: dethiobiotin synthase [Burkholderiales bacterium]
MERGFFVAGTDTGVGKTLVACALLHAFARRGQRAVGMKPVAAGVSDAAGRWGNADVAALAAAANVPADRSLVNPCLLALPVAPHIAAVAEGVAIDLPAIDRSFAELQQLADVVVVEGVGGFRVPLTDREDSADLAVRLGLPVILVVGMRLGCLSHALLTVEAIAARGLELAGWVANSIDPRMAKRPENVAALRARIAAPLLGEVPFLEPPDPVRAAAALELPAER